jgi:hypothetical protein
VVPPTGLDRRSFIGLAGAAVLAGCSAGATTGSRSSTADAATATGAATPTAAETAATTPAAAATSAGSASSTAYPLVGPLPHSTPWHPSSADVQPAVKQLAVQVVEALGAWGQDGRSGASARIAATGQDPALATQGSALLATAPAAVIQVVEAQYGGILAASACVLVVTRQWLGAADGSVTVAGSTVDVRLVRGTSGWRVAELHPSDPGMPSASLSAPARAVLANPRIDLPPASAADVRAGRVHDSVLIALTTLSQSYQIGVSVLRSGHPLDVFGTTRPSDHPLGRAFDTWRIDGQAVIDPATPRSLVTEYMKAAARAGSYNVGGPSQLGGGGFFSDDTHHDHVHAGFTT